MIIEYLIYGTVVAIAFLASMLIRETIEAVRDIKIAKYESFSATTDSDYDLYDFANWLEENRYANEGEGNRWVDEYVETH